MLHEYVIIGEGYGEKYAYNTATISRMGMSIVKGCYACETMKKYLVFYCGVIALMLADSLFLLRDNRLIREEGVNLFLNGYVIGVSMVMMFNRFWKRRLEHAKQGQP